MTVLRLASDAANAGLASEPHMHFTPANDVSQATISPLRISTGRNAGAGVMAGILALKA